jgi:ubiquinone/menaquinone biosynthesis C-methylase UbiE
MRLSDAITTWVSYIRRPAKRKLISYSAQLRGKKGIEIGGPSALFSVKGYFPVYLFAGHIDGANFSTNTIWEGQIQEGNNFHYYNKTGYQFIREATDLQGIADSSYDFVLSCHCLEHVANPLKALYEWKRVLKPGGQLVLVLPDKRHTFDINRPYTTLEHLQADYQNNVGEDDPTHFDEIIRLHVMDEKEGTREELVSNLQQNTLYRRAHHHVFSMEVIRQMLEACGFTVRYQQDGAPFHLITVATRGINN